MSLFFGRKAQRLSQNGIGKKSAPAWGERALYALGTWGWVAVWCVVAWAILAVTDWRQEKINAQHGEGGSW